MKRFIPTLTFGCILSAQAIAQNEPPVTSDPPTPPVVPELPSRPVPPPRAPFILPANPGFPRVQIQGGVDSGAPMQAGASAAFEGVARVGRPVRFSVTVMGFRQMFESPQIPDVEGLTFQPAGVTMNGGGAIVYRYTAIPSRAGKFVVPPFQFLAGTARITVPQSQLIVAEPQPGEERYQPVVGRIELPKRDFYVGETIPGRIVFLETADENPSYIQHIAKTNGSALFVIDNSQPRVEMEVDGKPRRGIAKNVKITPLKEGPAEVNCQAIVHVQKTDDAGLGRGFSSQQQSTIDVPSTRFNVLPLPKTGRLPGFTGAIGNFTLSAPKVSNTDVEMGEPITIAISLTGEGNLSGVAAPEVPADNPDWQTYKPTTDLDSPNDDAAPLLATKTFTYTLIPKRANVLSTPPIPFSYFDPVAAKFIDVTVPPQPVKVKQSTATEQPTVATTPAEPKTEEVQAGPKPIEAALTGLSETPGLWTRSLRPALWSRWFLLAQLVPVVFLLGLWASKRRREHLAANPQILRRRKARAAARIALGEARIAARQGNSRAFLAASTRAIREAAAPLDTAEAASLTQEEVMKILRDDERASKTAREIFENAEAHRYGATGDLKPGKLIADLEHTLARLSAKA